ncbi:MAG: hypothetical protein R6V12_07050 [Candidatus Hydrogenedentota bacterium]
MKKLVTFAGIVVVILGIAAFNQAYRLHRLADSYAQNTRSVRQTLIDRGVRPINWRLLEETKGEFESVPDYPPAVKKLTGKNVTAVGYGIPITGVSRSTFNAHQRASMLPLPTPVLKLLLGHTHAEKFQGVTEFILTPLPLECYWKKVPPLNQAIYVRTAKPIELTKGTAIAATGTFDLREQDGPKFFYVLEDAELAL